ncbi:hypothetical protein [Paenibacillus plantiphilus]|nr:hypothetical protein [Paenibacillus plantiphilus]
MFRPACSDFNREPEPLKQGFKAGSSGYTNYRARRMIAPLVGLSGAM